ncbi:MAG: M48 family metalloprotease [Symploca sp. SIO2E9]|nr:M48 family metalloprotease [Symploca sp. SIO2E9]
MKLPWNSLLISVGLVLSGEPSVVLAQSPKTSESANPNSNTSELLPRSSLEVEALAPITPREVDNISLVETSSFYRQAIALPKDAGRALGAAPKAIAIPEILQESYSAQATSEALSESADTIVIPNVAPVESPLPLSTQQAQATENEETTTAPIPVEEGEAEADAETDVTNQDQTNVAPSEKDQDIEEEAQENPETDIPEPEDVKEEAQAEESKLSPEEIARQQRLIEADRLYQSGEATAATQLYREAKEAFEVEAAVDEQLEPFYDPAELTPAGAVYWRLSGEGLEQQLETKTLVPLKFLVENEPEFIPGYVRYAQALRDYEQLEEAIQLLERASTLYPNQPQLLKVTIEAMGESEQWLEASLKARQFALLNREHPQAEEFEALADEYMESYKSHLRRKLRGNAIANVITGTIGYVVTGNLFGPISAIQTTALMLRGESAVGRRYAQQVQRRIPMLEDEEVLEYVREIGNKLAAVAGRDEFEYEFYVIMDDRINAFALPGGKIFVNAGAIMETKSEAELAGLLAHELAHAVLSHGFQLVTEGNLIANITQYIPYGGTAANLIVLDYSRDMERQADDLGTRILASGGYAADGLYNLMVTLDEQEQERPIFAWLSTHPATKERINNLKTMIERNGYNRYTYEGVEQHLVIQEKVGKLLEKHKQWEECLEDKECREKLEEEDREDREDREDVENPQ